MLTYKDLEEIPEYIMVKLRACRSDRELRDMIYFILGQPGVGVPPPGEREVLRKILHELNIR